MVFPPTVATPPGDSVTLPMTYAPPALAVYVWPSTVRTEGVVAAAAGCWDVAPLRTM